MPIGFVFSANRYKQFIKEFRRECTRGAGFFEVNAGNKGFRFRRSDEYLVSIRNTAHGAFVDLQTHPRDQGHYQNMARVETITKSSIDNAFLTNFGGGYDTWSASLRIIAFVTAEAARSDVVYRAVQSAINGKEIAYDDYVAYLTTYRKNREYNGIPDNEFRVLKESDYRAPSFIIEQYGQ